jgi:hypothetical protein
VVCELGLDPAALVSLASKQHKVASKQRRKVRALNITIAQLHVARHGLVVIPKASQQKHWWAKEGNLPAKVVRKGRSLCPSMAQAKMKETLGRHRGKMLHTTEFATTQLCDRCGFRNRFVGRAKVFRCPPCGALRSRDGKPAEIISAYALRVTLGSGSSDRTTHTASTRRTTIYANVGHRVVTHTHPTV